MDKVVRIVTALPGILFVVLGLRYKDQIPRRQGRIFGFRLVPFIVIDIALGFIIPYLNNALLIPYFNFALPFTLLSGRPKTYVKESDSGKTSHQLFCPECASPLYSTSVGDGPKFLNLRLGTARQRAELRPRVESWCGSGQEWVSVQGKTEKLETQ